MAFGLQVSNAASQTTLDTSSRLPRFLGTISSNQPSGSLFVPEIGANNGTAIFLERALPSNPSTSEIGVNIYFPVNISYSYPNITWSLVGTNQATFAPGLIEYGYY